MEWLSFGLADSLTRTVVHFFPASASGGAPYPVRCRLSIFGEGITASSVILDEARLNQPDGFFLDDVFTELKEKKVGLIGIGIEIVPAQNRVDVSQSQCIVELASPFRTIRFRPACRERPEAGNQKIDNRMGAGSEHASLLIRDGYHLSSIVLLNGSEETQNVTLRAVPMSTEPETVQPILMEVPALSPTSVIEIPVSAEVFERAAPSECSWGVARLARLDVKLGSEVTGYIVLRDPESRRPLSVLSI